MMREPSFVSDGDKPFRPMHRLGDAVIWNGQLWEIYEIDRHPIDGEKLGIHHPSGARASVWATSVSRP